MKRVYLAGFDVFYPDAKARGEAMKVRCARYGLAGCYPLDNEACDAEKIFRGNIALIDECDALVANLNAFRGGEPDSGTAFEMGYACAKGKPVFVYREDCRTMREVLGETDAAGFAVEDFNLPINLMLGCAAEGIEESLDASLKKVQEFF